MRIKVSVCIPVYKVEKYIEQCVRSLFGQTLADGIEFIFVDDCSPDNSILILRETLLQYPERREQVKILRHDRNLGLVAARKTALAAACGDYIVHCDSDDWVDAELYEKMLDKAVSADADVVICDLKMEYDNGRSLRQTLSNAGSLLDFFETQCPSAGFNAFVNKLYRSKIAKDPSMVYPEGLTCCEDLMYNVQALLQCKTVAYCQDGCYHYRQDGASMSHGRGEKDFRSVKWVVTWIIPKLADFRAYAAADRLRRDIILLSLRVGVRDAEFARAIIKGLHGCLWADARYGMVKKLLLIGVVVSYPVVASLLQCLRIVCHKKST